MGVASIFRKYSYACFSFYGRVNMSCNRYSFVAVSFTSCYIDSAAKITVAALFIISEQPVKQKFRKMLAASLQT